ncbi:helix-turn-helix domain-containing protein [Sphingobacterium faecium]
MKTLSIMSDNIRYLRMQVPDLTQSKISDHLGITRDAYAKYEMGKTAPPLDVLVGISRFFEVSTDLLLTADLRKYKLEGILPLPHHNLSLSIITDPEGENKMEIISHDHLLDNTDPDLKALLQHLIQKIEELKATTK